MNSFKTLIDSAEEASKHKKWSEAEKLWKTLMDKHINNPPIITYVRLCTAYRKQRLFQEAEDIVLAAMKKWPDFLALLTEYADIASNQGNWPEAERRWKVVLDKHMDKTPRIAYICLSTAYRNQKMYKEA